MTVVIPAHNAAATLHVTLLSARGQSYDPLEILVVNDGSTDGTAAIAAAHAREDSRVRLISQDQQGVASARNCGIANAAGELVATLDADDLWHPMKIERQVQTMKQVGEAASLVYGWSTQIDEDGYILMNEGPAQKNSPDGYVLPDLLLGNFIGNGSSPLMRRDVVLEAGGYDPGLRAQGAEGCEDLKLYLAIAETHLFATVPMALTGYRISKTSMSSDVRRMLRSHHLVTEQYRERYPNEVRYGRVDIALYYAERELARGNYSVGFQALRSAVGVDLGTTAKGGARRLLGLLAPRGRALAREPLERSVARTLFPTARDMGFRDRAER